MTDSRNVFSRVIAAVLNRGSVEQNPTGELNYGSAYGQGAYTPMFNAIVPRSFQPELAEGLREALPILDGLIDRLVTLDGVPVIVGDSSGLVDEIREWAKEVQVNELQKGLHSFSHAMRGEVHEQGFNIPEYVYAADQRDIVRLNVPDSKALRCGRKEDGSLQWFYNPRAAIAKNLTSLKDLEIRQSSSVGASFYMEDKSFGAINMGNKCYMAYSVENGDPYGVSRLRSMPFVAKALLTIQNGTAKTHERFGDPSYHVGYEAKGKIGDDALKARQKALEQGFKASMQAKMNGQAVDFVTATDRDSKVDISVIGAGGEVLDIKEPSQLMHEGIVAKGGIAPWLLGLHFGTSERLAKYQSEIMKQESDTRTHIEGEVLETIIKAMLRARGRTWSDETVVLEDGRRVRKAWRVEFEKPNLGDILAQAQTKFMNAQADAVRENAGVSASSPDVAAAASSSSTGASDEETSNLIIKQALESARYVNRLKKAQDIKALETRPIDNPALDIIEKDALRGVDAAWQDTTDYIVRALGLDSEETQASMQSDGFTLTDKDTRMIADELSSFVLVLMANEGLSQGALTQAYVRAWALGVIDGYTRAGLEAPIGELNNDAAVAQLLANSKKEFEGFISSRITPRITRILEAGVAAGDSPLTIAANLRKEMGGAKWKWEQITRSETAMAWDEAKRGEWQAEIADGVTDDLFDFIPAPDGCPQCQTQAEGNPRVLAKTPKPVVDTHPSCRCDVMPHLA